jgi:hypothetical protein
VNTVEVPGRGRGPAGLTHYSVRTDLATNIAEDVLFTVLGEVVRHRGVPGQPRA